MKVPIAIEKPERSSQMIRFLKRKHFLSFVFISIRAKWYRTKAVVAATIAGRFCKDCNDYL